MLISIEFIPQLQFIRQSSEKAGIYSQKINQQTLLADKIGMKRVAKKD
jgi:hypothetical protein